MSKKLIPSNPIIEYSDYKKFTNFLDDKFQISLKNINPYEFYRLDANNINSKINLREYVNRFFKTRYNPIPIFKISEDGFSKYQRFEDFTSRDEVHNLSLWSLSCLNNLSFGNDARLGKELEIIRTNNPRDGRLDVVVLSNEELLVLEAKVSLPTLLSEGRFKYQIPAYYKECQAVVEKHNSETGNKYKFSILLIIGGEETDLYPPNHPDCTSGQVGDISKIFYDNLLDHRMRFISANALWALASTAEILEEKIYWYKIIPKLFKEKNTLGLLSGGKVVLEEGRLTVIPIDLKSQFLLS